MENFLATLFFKLRINLSLSLFSSRERNTTIHRFFARDFPSEILEVFAARGKIGELAWTEERREGVAVITSEPALSGRGEDFTSVVALSNVVVAPSKTVCKRRCLLRGQCY